MILILLFRVREEDNLNILRDKKYCHVLHFVLSAEQPKKRFIFKQNDTKVKMMSIEEIKKSNNEVLGFSEIIENHKLSEFNSIYSFDLDSSSEVIMFSKEEIENSEFFYILVLIKTNPNLNLIVDNVVKKLAKINKFKNINFSLEESELATIYSLEIINNKFELTNNKYGQSKIEIIKKGELVTISKTISWAIVSLIIFFYYVICNIMGCESTIFKWAKYILPLLIPPLIGKTFTYISVLRKNGKYNNSYFVLNTNYNFEDELKHKIKFDPNIPNDELQTPTEE